MSKCPPHPRDSVEKISGLPDDRTGAKFFICSECGDEFEGEYDKDEGGYVELNNPFQD